MYWPDRQIGQRMPRSVPPIIQVPDFPPREAPQLKKGKKHPLMKRIFDQIEIYCEKSTLHGLRYLGDTSLSLAERCFWFIAFASAFSFAAYYISNIFAKWNSNPVLIAFSPFDATLNDIPFPALTICNMNQAKKVEADRINRHGTSTEKRLLTDYCKTNNHSFVDYDDRAPAWQELQNFLIKVGQSCSDTLKTCIWQSDRISCNEYFNNELTDEGLCCSFNRLPPEYLFKNPDDVTVLNQTFWKKVHDWSPEAGFPDDNDGSTDIVPLRPAGAGAHLGLTLLLDTQVNNYYCSSTQSYGFKLYISNPIETPKIADYGFLVSPGMEARYVVKPVIREATESLRDTSIEKRQCFFENERQLTYFRAYSQRNCQLECQSRYTLEKCGCVPYYLPKNKTTKSCGKLDEQCTDTTMEEMELVYGNGTSCNCLASCFEMTFEKSGSFSTLSSLNPRYGIDIPNEYFKKNMAVVHFFFGKSRYGKQIKSEIYGFTEALSNIGGLLGLCLGFSFLSFVELVYFVTLRMLCGYLRKLRKAHKAKADKGIVVNGLIPFVR